MVEAISTNNGIYKFCRDWNFMRTRTADGSSVSEFFLQRCSIDFALGNSAPPIARNKCEPRETNIGVYGVCYQKYRYRSLRRELGNRYLGLPEGGGEGDPTSDPKPLVVNRTLGRLSDEHGSPVDCEEHDNATIQPMAVSNVSLDLLHRDPGRRNGNDETVMSCMRLLIASTSRRDNNCWSLTTNSAWMRLSTLPARQRGCS